MCHVVTTICRRLPCADVITSWSSLINVYSDWSHMISSSSSPVASSDVLHPQLKELLSRPVNLLHTQSLELQSRRESFLTLCAYTW